MAVTKGLGFHVHTVRFNYAGYFCILSTPGFVPELLEWGSYCKCHPDMSVIFTDAASLLTLHNNKYWEVWLVVHVFFEDPSGSSPPPLGWQERSKVFDHWTLIKHGHVL